jgi:hypothetical protein
MSKQSPLYVSSNQRVPEYLQKSGSCISKPKLPLFAQLHTSTEAKVPIQNLSLPGYILSSLDVGPWQPKHKVLNWIREI